MFCFASVFFGFSIIFCTGQDIHPGSSLNLRVITYSPKGSSPRAQKLGRPMISGLPHSKVQKVFFWLHDGRSLLFTDTFSKWGGAFTYKETTWMYFRKQVKCSEDENSTVYLKKDLVQTSVVRVSSLQGLHWVSGLGSCDPDLSWHPFVGIGTQIRLRN